MEMKRMMSLKSLNEMDFTYYDKYTDKYHVEQDNSCNFEELLFSELEHPGKPWKYTQNNHSFYDWNG